MRTSSKIILGYAVLLLAVTLTLFILSKRHVIVSKVQPYITTMLPIEEPFSVVVVDSCCTCFLEFSGTNQLSWTHRVDSLQYSKPLTYVSNDTLYVIKTPTRLCRVHCTALNSLIVGKNSTVTHLNPMMNSLTLISHQGGTVVLNECMIEGAISPSPLTLTIQADNSNIHVFTPFESLTATMDGGSLTTSQGIAEGVRLHLTNKATVKLAESPVELDVDADASSRVVIDK